MLPPFACLRRRRNTSAGISFLEADRYGLLPLQMKTIWRFLPDIQELNDTKSMTTKYLSVFTLPI